jgi:hypothetical protein
MAASGGGPRGAGETGAEVVIDPPAKTTWRLALSESVLSVFNGLRRHFRVTATVQAPPPDALIRPGPATGRYVSLLASTEPKRRARFARRNETFRGSHRKSLKSLRVANQQFREIVCFQGREPLFVSPFSQVVSLQGLSSILVSPCRRPSWSFGRAMRRAGWAVTSHSLLFNV